MSEFLMVVPGGWTELNAVDWLDFSITAEALQHSFTQEGWEDIEQILGPRGEIPEGKRVIGGRMLMTNEGWRVWVLFG